MKRITIISALAAAMALPAQAQVANSCLRLSEVGTVNCGPVRSLDGLTGYTLQLWLCPDTWTPGATVLKRGDGLSLTLGDTQGNLSLKVGATTLPIASADLVPGQWCQLTVIVTDGAAKSLVNGQASGTGTLAAIPAYEDVSAAPDLMIGGGYAGRVDEVRLWSAPLKEQLNYFINNTLNVFNPQWSDLAAYYKMDQADCSNLVDYVSIETPDADTNNHGIFSDSGASRELCNDNSGLPYLINSAYTANERFYDRAIPREQYLLSNDLIILGVESLSDGHVRVITPNNHATASAAGVNRLDQWEERTGVASFDGTGSLTAPERCFEKSSSNEFTFETWLYIDEWVEGAYIFRKENADATQGFAVMLGAQENGIITIRCNGNKYSYRTKITPGSWNHIGITPGVADYPQTSFQMTLNGSIKSTPSSLCDKVIDNNPLGVEDYKAVIGEGLKGKIDDMLIWRMKMDTSLIKTHSTTVPMPGFGIVLTSYQMQEANTAFLFDDPEKPWWDSYSQDNWRDIMMSAYEGYWQPVVRISVKSHTGWQNTIANADRRALFAADLAEISKGYDGVELDLEWMDGTQTNLGHLGNAIRAALPEGKSLFISCHAYGAYRYPLGDMANVDGFTFQQYGPQNSYFQWSNYTSSTNNFINYGFDRKKIMTSYATTTSNGYENGSSASAVSGVRAGFFEGDDFTPDMNQGVMGGLTYWYTGPQQCYQRARYVVTQGLQGIFYWDMGNDVPVEHPYNLAKWASYGLNANIDRYVDKVSVRHANASGITDVKVDGGKGSLSIETDGDTLRVSCPGGVKRVEIYTTAGVLAGAADGSELSTATFAPGLYIVSATGADGGRHSGKAVL